ncbi:hypothetical protein H1D32_10825 [Anaerobacillus sp. CMMVII]|uniref:hypothetical protein n=1 Tax=Anaerobacillus sp. CMMVII TaxID=2755588 RepID=UPI0021B72D83|nr:hypothetical protein [Anaerobacillus sp. CMMVII]MCT8138206.1 hypothetical protein [Anaerobacillus sp. CMMVII]
MEPIFHFNPPIAEATSVSEPTISTDAVIGKGSIIVGDVRISEHVFIGFQNLIRADSSDAFYLGPYSNIQDTVVIHASPNEYLEFAGQKWGAYLEGYNTVLHQSVVHGPIFLGFNTYIGQSVSLNHVIIGRNCVIMHGATVANDVIIADHKYVAPGQTVREQSEADVLPEVPEKYKDLNRRIVDHYFRLGKSYKKHTKLFK